MSLGLDTEKKLTPMMEQYRSIKKTLPSDTILFFRLGDFYEMFFEDAVRGSEILDITLTGREGGEAGRIPMCGIPYHAFQGYVRTLIDHNLKVAICDQVGETKPAKGLVDRKVSRIISPATYLEAEEQPKKNEYMVAVVQGKEGGRSNLAARPCALAYLEMSTGEFFVREMEWDRLASELALLQPREVILPKSLAEEQSLQSFIKEALQASLTTYEDWVFEKEEGARLLQDNFQLASEKGISFHDRSLAVSAAGAILYYLRDHLHFSLGHIRFPSLLQAHEFMVLDRQTQRSLELVHSMHGNKQGVTLFQCLDQTLTSMGSRTLYHWVTHPLLTFEAIQKRQTSIAELMSESDRLEKIRSLLKGVKDMERTLSRLNYGVANARDLVNLKLFLDRVPEFDQALQSFKGELVQEIRGALNPYPELKHLITKAIMEVPPLTLKDGGIIREGFSTELDELRDISRNGKSWIMDFERREIERTGIKSLKVKYSGVFGYTLEVSKTNLHLVPDDYIRRQTLANAERFVVPELKVWDEKISGAQDKIKMLEYELFNQVREKVLTELSGLQKMAKGIGILDGLAGLAMTALQKKWVRPELESSGILKIEGGRHPVVESMLTQGQFVENDAWLDENENQLILLTGPNMAGKSTYIRQVGLIVLLAQMGSFVPATRAQIGLVDRIFTRIGASDDLARGESTFMVEMLETAHILQTATERSLIILDEVGRGTSTFDGVSIAWAICEHLAKGKMKPRTLFATHYHELTQLEDHFLSIKNYNILVKETRGDIVFLRKVARGRADRSYGIHVAKLAGIPESVTRRAQEILNVLESENTEATQIIEGTKRQKAAKAEAYQPSLFDAVTKSHPLLDEILALKLDEMAPLEALNKVAEWKRQLESETN